MGLRARPSPGQPWKPPRGMRDAVRLGALLLLLCAAPTARAQVVDAPPADSLPPLPDSLRLYGGAFATGAALPFFAAPDDAVALTLGEAVRIALEQNPDPAIAALEARRAALDATPAAAGYAPTLDASAGIAGSRSDDSRSAVRAFSGAEAGLTLGYTLFDATRAPTLARLRAEARRFGVLARAQAEALAFATTQAYLDVARQQALVASRADAVVLSRDRLRIEQSEVLIGTAAEIDAALALADLNADRAALLRQRLLLAQSRAALGGLLALPDPTAVTAADPLALDGPPDLAALAAAIPQGNRQVQALALARDAADEAVRAARAAFLPSLRASAGVGVTGDTDGLFPSSAPTGGADVRYGFSASLPIFDAGARRRRVATARIRQQQAGLDIAGEQAALRADAARLVTAAQGYRALADLEAQNERIAGENARVALAQLRLGFITPLDLRQVQLVLLDVQARRIEAVYQALRAESELRLLAGKLLPAAD